MSLLAILAAGTGGGTPGTPLDQRPATDDTLLQSIRPNGRSIATLTVGPGKQYANIKDANTAAKTLQTARLAAEGQATLTPNYRVDVLVDPGTYVGEVVAGRFVAFYATGPGALLKQNAAATTPELGVLTTNGDTYWEGINITQDDEPDTNRPKYPIHAVNRGTSIYANCTLTNNEPDVTTPFGMDGYDGGTTLLYGVTMGPGGTNAHGWENTRIPQTMMYVKCASPSTVGWNALNNIAVDQLWVVESNVRGVVLAGTSSVAHIAPSNTLGDLGVSLNGASQDVNAAWPVPTGGLSAADRAFYGM